ESRKVAHIAGPEGVVIREGSACDDARTKRFDGPPQSRRTRDPRHKPHLEARKGFGRSFGSSRKGSNSTRATPGGELQGTRGEDLDRACVRGRKRSVDDTNDVGASQRRKRLAQRSPRQHPSVSEAEPTVDGQEFDVASQPVVVEAVVEHENVGA